MKRLIANMLLSLGLFGLVPLPVSAFENLSSALNTEQQACFSLAMVGMDSVINARLGVPAEHALELSSRPQTVNTMDAESYDTNLLRVILDAYLWQETPHSYAIKVFYICAAQSSYKNHAKFE